MLSIEEKTHMITRQMELFTAAAIPALIHKYGENSPLVASRAVAIASQVMGEVIPLIEEIAWKIKQGID